MNTLPGLAPKQNKNTPQTLQGWGAAAAWCGGQSGPRTFTLAFAKAWGLTLATPVGPTGQKVSAETHGCPPRPAPWVPSSPLTLAPGGSSQGPDTYPRTHPPLTQTPIHRPPAREVPARLRTRRRLFSERAFLAGGPSLPTGSDSPGTHSAPLSREERATKHLQLARGDESRPVLASRPRPPPEWLPIHPKQRRPSPRGPRCHRCPRRSPHREPASGAETSAWTPGAGPRSCPASSSWPEGSSANWAEEARAGGHPVSAPGPSRPRPAPLRTSDPRPLAGCWVGDFTPTTHVNSSRRASSCISCLRPDLSRAPRAPPDCGRLAGAAAGPRNSHHSGVPEGPPTPQVTKVTITQQDSQVTPMRTWSALGSSLPRPRTHTHTPRPHSASVVPDPGQHG